MSRDIRSFFVKKDGGSSVKNDESSFKTSKKRNIRVIESDSDEDVLIVERPAHKKHKESKSDKKEQSKKKESPQKNAKTAEKTPVSAKSFFGTSPIQQKPQTIKQTDKTPTGKEKKSTESSEKTSGKKEKSKKSKKQNESASTDRAFTIENDDGFDETLLQISETDIERLAKKDKPRTPVKKEETAKVVKTPPSHSKTTPVKQAENPSKSAKTPGSADSKASKKNPLDSEQKRKQAESYQRYLNRGGPKNPGSKEIPKGTPTCLQGYTFVISGVLESMEREEAAELIQKCGGRVTSSVSGKTNFIVVGEDAGQAKLEKANKLGTKKLTEDDLLDMIRTKSKLDDDSGSSQDNFIEGTPKKDTSIYFKTEKSKAKRSLDTDKSPDDNRKKARKAIEVEPPKFHKKTKASDESSGYETQPDSQSSQPSHSQQGSIGDGSATTQVGECLWVEKYKPKTTKQIIGQSGDKSNVKKLIYWLQNWQKNHSNQSGKKAKPAPWQSQDGSAFKAALLSGPPGVGKTTSVQLVCKELGLDAIEFNASNTRSKKLLKDEVAELLTTKSVLGYFQGHQKPASNHVLVMDEVDGMAGNEDRSGIQELIQFIKTTKVPIICMCNDRSHPKIRSLVNYCFDLRFNRPRVEQIKGAMMSVCFKENVKIPNEALEEIIINANQDVRQVLHNLSMWSVRDKSIGSDQAKTESAKAKKPLNLSPWDAVRRNFSSSERSSMTFRDKEELFFQDYSLGPLFVQDTYIRVKPHKAKNDVKETLNLLSKSADAILLGDIVERRIRSENAWGLLPVQAIFSSVLPGHYMEGHVQGQIQFPVWLGKNSKRNRYDRILQELQMHMRLSISGSKEAVNLDYLHMLRDGITRPLLTKGVDGVGDTRQLMNDYNLTREDIESIMELSQWPGRKDIFASIDSKVKAALTRAYNKEGKTVPFATSRNAKKTKTAEDELDMDGMEVDGEEEIAESDNDDVELDAMIKKGKSKSKPEPEEPKGKAKKEKKAPKKEKKKT